MLEQKRRQSRLNAEHHERVARSKKRQQEQMRRARQVKGEPVLLKVLARLLHFVPILML
jgi:hypothetical protein